jgi:hypothetical protein
MSQKINLVLLLAGLLVLAACGVKSAPTPPEGSQPRTYPQAGY